MFENLIEFHLGDHMSGHLFDPPIAPMGNVRALSPNRRPYPTKDGMISMLIGVDKHWTAFLEVAGLHEQHSRDPRFATPAARAQNIEAMLAFIAEALKTKTTAEWLKLLAQGRHSLRPGADAGGIARRSAFAGRRLLRPLRSSDRRRMTIPQPAVWMSETPPAIETLAPQLGAHTREVLGECGYSAGEIDALLTSGVAKQRR